MATSVQRYSTLWRRGITGALCILIILFVVMATVTACRSIRATSKIGLLAPFEGLYRRSGYTALQAMRLALADAPDAARDRLPLALDVTLDPQRAMEKLLADSTVGAVIGPLTPQAASKVRVLRPEIAWYVPFAISATGEFVALSDFDAWAKPLFLTVADAMQRQGRARLIVAGWPAGWPAPLLNQWSAEAGLPFVVDDNPAIVQGDDAIFHFGDPADAAAYLHRIRATYADLPFVMGPSGEDPVFVEHSPATHAVYWVTWTDAGYREWANLHPLSTRLSYLVYRATQAALMAGKVAPAPTATQWTVQLMALEDIH